MSCSNSFRARHPNCETGGGTSSRATLAGAASSWQRVMLSSQQLVNLEPNRCPDDLKRDLLTCHQVRIAEVAQEPWDKQDRAD